MTTRLSVVVLAGWLLVATSGLAAQEFRAGLAVDSATVGDVVAVVVSGVVPAGVGVVFPDSLPLGADLENAARRRETADTVEGGVRRSAVYAVTPWRPGVFELPVVEVGVSTPDSVRTVEVALPVLTVMSVLPEDTAGVEARPPRDVLGPSWLLWPLLLLLALLLAMLAAAYLWYRATRPPTDVVPLVPRRSARERALEALDQARALPLVEAGRHKAFHSLLSEILRRYLAALDGAWGEDLTTSELLARLDGVEAEDRRVLGALLEAMDRVKFAQHRPGPEAAEETWGRARDWVERFRPPPAPEGPGPGGPGARSGPSGKGPPSVGTRDQGREVA